MNDRWKRWAKTSELRPVLGSWVPFMTGFQPSAATGMNQPKCLPRQLQWWAPIPDIRVYIYIFVYCGLTHVSGISPLGLEFACHKYVDNAVHKYTYAYTYILYIYIIIGITYIYNYGYNCVHIIIIYIYTIQSSGIRSSVTGYNSMSMLQKYCLKAAIFQGTLQEMRIQLPSNEKAWWGC